jgi:hypothetical protein
LYPIRQKALRALDRTYQLLPAGWLDLGAAARYEADAHPRHRRLELVGTTVHGRLGSGLLKIAHSQEYKQGAGISRIGPV